MHNVITHRLRLTDCLISPSERKAMGAKYLTSASRNIVAGTSSLFMKRSVHSMSSANSRHNLSALLSEYK